MISSYDVQFVPNSLVGTHANHNHLGRAFVRG